MSVNRSRVSKDLSPMMTIGPTKKSIEQVSVEIRKILNTSAGDDVKIKALEILEKVGSVSNVSVSSCNFTKRVI